MMRSDPNYTSVCAICYQGTWYAPTAIEVSPCTRDRAAFVTDPSRWEYGNRAHLHGAPEGTHNLRVIDRSALAPAFTRWYLAGDRVRVRFADGEEMTGIIGRSTGWRPVYLLMCRADSIGSPHVLGRGDRVIAVKRGREYVPVMPR
jgi:hypothetical protein